MFSMSNPHVNLSEPSSSSVKEVRSSLIDGGRRGVTGRPLAVEVGPGDVVFAVRPVIVDIDADDEDRVARKGTQLLDKDSSIDDGLHEPLTEQEGVAVGGPHAAGVAQPRTLPVISNQLRVPSLPNAGQPNLSHPAGMGAHRERPPSSGVSFFPSK